VILNVIGAPSQASQIISEMQTQRSSQKRAIKKIRFFQIVKRVFFILTPSTSSEHNFLTSNSFFSIFRAIDAPRGGLHLLCGHHKQ
jgi:hypothetical protein